MIVKYLQSGKFCDNIPKKDNYMRARLIILYKK